MHNCFKGLKFIVLISDDKKCCTNIRCKITHKINKFQIYIPLIGAKCWHKFHKIGNFFPKSLSCQSLRVNVVVKNQRAGPRVGVKLEIYLSEEVAHFGNG